MMDPARLDRILALLPPEDAAYLASLVEPPWKVRQRRLDARDEAVREALGDQGGLSPTAAARELETRLHRYLAAGWAHDRRNPPTEPRRAALYRLAEANGGEPLGWRQIMRAAAAQRAGVS